MSYVLNALRRADAERERGAVPDLHAQPALDLGDEERPARWRMPWLALLGLAAAGLLAALVWLLATRQPPPPAPAPATSPAPMPPVARAASSPAAAPPQVLIRIEAPAAAPAPARAAAPAPSTTRPAEAPVEKWAELPEAWRRQVPAMTFGGAMDSPVASSRMLIVNGQVLREGESPSPGLVLERIQLRSAVFSFQGRRFEVSY